MSALLLVGAFAAPAASGTAQFMGGVPLVGPQAVIWCTDGSPFQPGQVDKADLAGPGTVSFMVSDAWVGATVTLRGAQPYTAYVVRVIQGTQYLPASDCQRVDAVIRTDGWGNGAGSVREWRIPTGNSVQVIVDTGQVYRNPTYRGKMWMTFSPIAAVEPTATRSGGAAYPTNSASR